MSYVKMLEMFGSLPSEISIIASCCISKNYLFTRLFPKEEFCLANLIFLQ